ncbi:hypothetical protein [Moritella viscosa]|uniref:hypothetical protein n=1 Tax=Moritella viscosa TaxID=80854 RepID=UPI00094D51FF|nr:hypothetical protein [Moritella viscosa]
MYTVRFECLNRGKLINFPLDIIELNFTPRADDSIAIGDTYYDIKSVMYNSSKANEITLYVNPIGDKDAYHKLLKSKEILVDVNPVPFSRPNIF